MGGMKDKRQEPGKGREEQKRPQRPGQDPAHPDSGTGARGKTPDELKRRREEDVHPGERDRSDEDF
ncbi:hypothetical protein ACGFYU_10705 [Streptomyces sp. NPDC048337]|uniref:hypothetical protein n=1 Tax=Streptomyces sp. NPDC048337 TaxID=3365535 RepID=UPI00371023B6